MIFGPQAFKCIRGDRKFDLNDCDSLNQTGGGMLPNKPVLNGLVESSQSVWYDRSDKTVWSGLSSRSGQPGDTKGRDRAAGWSGYGSVQIGPGRFGQAESVEEGRTSRVGPVGFAAAVGLNQPVCASQVRPDHRVGSVGSGTPVWYS